MDTTSYPFFTSTLSQERNQTSTAESSIWFNTIAFPIVLITISSNLVVIINAIKYKKELLINSYNCLVLSLCVSDFLVGVSFPIASLNFLLPAMGSNYYVCVAQMAFNMIMYIATCIQVLVINIDVLVAIALPLKHKIYCTVGRTRWIIAGIWAAAIFLTGLLQLFLPGHENFEHCSIKHLLRENYASYQLSVVIIFFTIYTSQVTVYCIVVKKLKALGAQKTSEGPLNSKGMFLLQLL